MTQFSDGEPLPEEIVIFGCGVVGLATAAAFLLRGLAVAAVDIDSVRLADLRTGRFTADEPEVNAALAAALRAGRLRFLAAPARSEMRRAFVLAVPTPIDARRIPVERQVEDAFDAARSAARSGDLIVIRSTVPIGTARRLAERSAATGVKVASCPDRSLEGASLSGQTETPAIVGGIDAEATNAAVRLFSLLGPVVSVSSPEAAEAAKLFCNVQRDAVFALANQFAMISETLQLDFEEIRQAASRGYPRFLPTRPGPVGGPCLPKDIHLLAGSPGIAGTNLAALGLAARETNVSVVDHVAAVLLGHLAALPMSEGPPVLAIIGLAFKTGTRDQRGSFALSLADRLRILLPAAVVRTVDSPVGSAETSHAAAGAHVVVLAQDGLGPESRDVLAQLMAREGLIYELWDGPAPAPTTLPNGVALRRYGTGTPPAQLGAPMGAYRRQP